jgi:hypothetical protein
MTTNTATEILRLEQMTDALTSVALLKQEPKELSEKNNSIIFKESYDELDDLDFAAVNLNTGEKVSLIRHRRRPQGGTAICVAVVPEKAGGIIQETCNMLGVTSQDLIWIHPTIQISTF